MRYKTTDNIYELDKYPRLKQSKLIVIIDKYSIRIEISDSIYNLHIPFDQVVYLFGDQIILGNSDPLEMASFAAQKNHIHYGSLLYYMRKVLIEDLLWIKDHFARNLEESEYHVFVLKSDLYDYNSRAFDTDKGSYKLEFLEWIWEQRSY